MHFWREFWLGLLWQVPALMLALGALRVFIEVILHALGVPHPH